MKKTRERVGFLLVIKLARDAIQPFPSCFNGGLGVEMVKSHQASSWVRSHQLSCDLIFTPTLICMLWVPFPLSPPYSSHLFSRCFLSIATNPFALHRLLKAEYRSLLLGIIAFRKCRQHSLNACSSKEIRISLYQFHQSPFVVLPMGC